MNEKLYKLNKQKTKINKDIRKIYYNIETNEDEIIKIIK